jgi:hypothetical protein
MRTIALCFLLLLEAGCSITPTQKKWASVAAVVLVTGAIAAHNGGSSDSENRIPTPRVSCDIDPASCQ